MKLKSISRLAVCSMAMACLTACTTVQTDPLLAQCTADKKDVSISYGDSHLKADAKTNIKPDGALVFNLKPDKAKGPNGLDYSGVTVTLRGKDDKSAWIAATGTASANSDKLIVCVPDNQAEDTYSYLVEVVGVGTLDPRVVVVK
jgi:hypothetical protein